MPTERPAAHLLVVEPDDDLRETLAALLEELGYGVTCVATPAEAHAGVDAATYDLILTAPLAQRRDELFAHADALRAHAYPTPVGVLTGWPVIEEAAAGHGFAFVLGKPFELDRLVALIAAALDTPLSEEQRRHAEVVGRYFAALAARDWDGFIALCTEDVRYELPGEGGFATTLVGSAALRAYTEEVYRPFADVTFDNLRVFALPDGLAARYVGSWTAPDGSRQSLGGAVIFQFEGERIRHIGVRLSGARLEALAAEQQQAQASPAGGAQGKRPGGTQA